MFDQAVERATIIGQDSQAVILVTAETPTFADHSRAMRRRLAFGCVVSLIAASVCQAQQVVKWDPIESANAENLLPDKPEPIETEPTHVVHRFLDTKGKIAIGTNLALKTLDAVGTCRTLAAGGHEDWLPTQHCAPASALIFGEFAFDVSLAYIFHRTGHHKLERIAEVLCPADSVAGIVYTESHGGQL